MTVDVPTPYAPKSSVAMVFTAYGLWFSLIVKFQQPVLFTVKERHKLNVCIDTSSTKLNKLKLLTCDAHRINSHRCNGSHIFATTAKSDRALAQRNYDMILICYFTAFKLWSFRAVQWDCISKSLCYFEICLTGGSTKWLLSHLTNFKATGEYT